MESVKITSSIERWELADALFKVLEQNYPKLRRIAKIDEEDNVLVHVEFDKGSSLILEGGKATEEDKYYYNLYRDIVGELLHKN